MIKYPFYLLLLVSAITLCASFTKDAVPEDDFHNLKVLPKDITKEQLDSVMDHFRASLGVKCSFCHAQAKDSSLKKHLDFASDEKPEKLRAREMLQMTAYLNANFFNPHQSDRTDTIHEVICYTCHRGTEAPDASLLFVQVDSIMRAQHKK
jgi:hypothetical protein